MSAGRRMGRWFWVEIRNKRKPLSRMKGKPGFKLYRKALRQGIKEDLRTLRLHEKRKRIKGNTLTERYARKRVKEYKESRK
jgi:hypothetical protein